MGDAVGRMERQLAAVAEVARLAVGETDVERLVASVAQVVARTLPVERVALLRCDETGETLVCGANVGWPEDEIRPVPVTSASLVAEVFCTGEPLAIGEERMSPHVLQLGLRRAAAVVVAHDGDRVGVLTVHDDAPEPFAPADVAFLELVAGLVASAAARRASDSARAVSEQQARETNERLGRLQSLTSALAAALTEQEIVDVILREGVAASGAAQAVIGFVDDARRAVVIRGSTGYPDGHLDAWLSFGIDEALPLSEVARTGASAFCETRGERNERWPALSRVEEAPSHAFAALALLGRAEPLGGLGLSFAADRPFSREERSFLDTLAWQCGQALERARAHESERRASRRLSFLAEATRTLNEVLDYEQALENLGAIVVPELADWYAVVLVAGGDFRQVTVRHRDPERTRAAEEIWSRYRPVAGEGGGVAAVVESGTSVLVPEVTDEMLVGAARGPEHLAMLREVGMRSVMIVPLRSAGGTLGTISFVAAESGHRYDAGDLAFAEELAARAAATIERARLYDQRAEQADAASVLAHVDDGVVQVDATGVVRFWNRAAELIFDTPAGEARGRGLDEVVEGWHAVVPALEVASSPFASGSRPAVPLMLRGEERWLEVSAVRQPAGTVYAFRDVTAEHDVEEARRDFLTTASHELRTPLAAVYGAARTLEARALDGNRRDTLVHMIVEQSDRLARIVDDILLANNLGLEKVPVESDVVDVAQLLEDAAAARAVDLPPALELVVDTSATTGARAVADAKRLRQVIDNLLDNAIKYSPEGGTVTLGTTSRDGRVTLLVRDSGIGIPAAQLDKIFDKFHRLDPQLNRGVGGTGLGLYISRELVRRMNGAIRVESRPGRGSTFAVDVPAAA